MKKDIEFPEVTGVIVAIAKSANNLGESQWDVYLINKNLIALDNVFVVSKGLEMPDGSGRTTSTLRHSLGKIEALSFVKVEGLSPEVFSLHNEFWVSYYIVRELFDKKFIIQPFQEFNLEKIEELGLMGVYAE